jgi:hypothetical protein
VFVRLAAHGLFICWSLEWTSPVDELWKHLNPPSADYIETNVLKTKSPAKNGSCRSSRRDIQSQDALLPFRASPR